MIIAMYVAVALIGYLLGSIPFGLLISRRSTGTDIRHVGSGKTGMTNVLRTAGKKAAVLALVLDIAKGALAVILAGLIFENLGYDIRIAQIVAGLLAIAGHSWPIFVKFKGGRGVATFLGALLPICWQAAIFGGLVMIFIAALSRYMSLGSITGAIVAFIIQLVLTLLDIYHPELLIYTLIGAIFIIVMHRDNISRLLAGTERKLGEKVEADNLPSSGSY